MKRSNEDDKMMLSMANRIPLTLTGTHSLCPAILSIILENYDCRQRTYKTQQNHAHKAHQEDNCSIVLFIIDIVVAVVVAIDITIKSFLTSTASGS